MWIHRVTSFIKPGLMAEAVAHHASQPLSKGMTRRLLRPITGEQSTTKLVIELGFGDADAVYTAFMQPGPLSESSKKWIELNENRGTHELLQVVHEVPAQGPVGEWVDRRVFYVRRTAEAIAILKSMSGVSVEGYSCRLSRPRTGAERESILIQDATFASLEQAEVAIANWFSSPEGVELMARWREVTQGRGIDELYRIMG